MGGAYAGHLDVYVHPDGQAIEVAELAVSPDHRLHHLESVMMDALYAAYPTAWVNHGGRGPDETLWWDSYSEPAPERNPHNRPPAEWAHYFDPIVVASQKARNAYRNRYQGVDGHRAAVYRYGEPMEAEARQHAHLFHEPEPQGPNPNIDDLYGGVRLFLPPRLHRIVHDSSRDATQRAELVLDHLGYGNLPHHSAWNITERGAFEDLVHEQIFDTESRQPVTHLIFRILLQPDGHVPPHDVKATWVRFIDSPGIEVGLAGMSWRSPQRPEITHTANFDPPFDAAIAPEHPADASFQYRARYSEFGDLLPGQMPRRAGSTAPYAGREAEIQAWADRLRQGTAQRANDRPNSVSGQTASADYQVHHRQPSQQQTPRTR
ncbi:hypothetical protein AB0H23_32595 [Streptomyces albogriseolus]|uniref:hypothetical protein n=1 Tax=Streptomyces albogriseolus TaxID=1887 RepID=UPI00346075E6